MGVWMLKKGCVDLNMNWIQKTLWRGEQDKLEKTGYQLDGINILLWGPARQKAGK
jgi:hypothetical protein